MISHVSLGVCDLQRSGVFYDRVMAALGVVRVWSSDTGIGYGEPGRNDKLALFPRSDPAGLAAGAGFHLAFTAPSPEAVDRFHTEALAAGGTSLGEAGPRPHYGPTYYAAFVRDLDGHKLEAVSQ